MVFLVSDRAPSTLKKHLCGWRRWLDFCKGAAISAGYPSCWEVVEFLGALAEGAHTDRGSGRVANATGVMHVLRFMIFKLDLFFGDLSCAPGCRQCSWLSAIASWRWQRCSKRMRVAFFLRALLLMPWAGLRLSDAQRIPISAVQLDGRFVRGCCWRSKTSATGFPWGGLLGGCTGGMWGRMFAAVGP